MSKPTDKNNAESSTGRKRYGLSAYLMDTGRTISFRPAIARAVGGIYPALFLEQLAYWTPKASDPDGWVYKMQAEWEEETGLSRDQQETARKILKGLGVLEERYSRLDHRMFYRFVPEVLDSLWEGGSHSRKGESRIRETGKVAVGKGGKSQSVLPEITQEITAGEETRANAPGPVKPKGNGHPGVAMFCDEYLVARGKPYVVTGRDAKALKDLWGDLGEAEFRARLLRFLSLDDPFIVARLHAAWLFPTRVNELDGRPAPSARLLAEEEMFQRSRREQEKYEAEETERRRKMLGLPEGTPPEQTEAKYQEWLGPKPQ